jgi:hypothetical protein
MKTLLTLVIAWMLFLVTASAVTIHVPENYLTIGEAIQAASNGDSILVGPGIYDQVPFSINSNPEYITLLGNGYLGADRSTIIGSGIVPQAKVDLINVDGWEIGGFEMIASNKGVSADGCHGVHLHDLYIHETSWNYADGIGLDENTDVVIERCIITDVDYAGINLFYNDNGDVTIRNNTICSSPNGILVLGDVPNLVLENNIITGCGDGVEFHGQWTPALFLDYNDVWNNGDNWYNCTPGPHNISANPQFVGGPGGGQYLLQASSPCIDAGNPGSPHDPDGTIADIGCFWYDQGPGLGVASLDLEPVAPPIVVPVQGGSFDYTATLSCDTTGWTAVDAWADLRLPNGLTMGPLFIRPDIHMDAGQSLLRSLQMYVSAWAMPGTYWFRGYLGDNPSQTVVASDSFSFVKAESNGFPNPGQNAYLTIIGWDDPVQVELPVAESALPQQMTLSASPNPFNPSTAISYELRAASFVSLRVYDTAGRLVATLVDGWRNAGSHSVKFDGSGLASGMYLAVLETGGLKTAQRMLLMK